MVKCLERRNSLKYFGSDFTNLPNCRGLGNNCLLTGFAEYYERENEALSGTYLHFLNKKSYLCAPFYDGWLFRNSRIIAQMAPKVPACAGRQQGLIDKT